MSKGDIHVLPNNDLAEHLEAEGCPCNPRVEIQDNGVAVVIHNSWDKREFDELDNPKSKLN